MLLITNIRSILTAITAAVNLFRVLGPRLVEIEHRLAHLEATKANKRTKKAS